MNRDLTQHAAELELANRELEAFGYSLSHDIRSYLTRISVAAQALEEFSVDQVCADGNLCLKTILGACEGMETLIEAMLVLARVNQQDLQLERVDLATVARWVAEEMTQAESCRNIRFEIPEEIAVDGDPHLLRVVLENLFGNACKYSRDREVAEVTLAVGGREGRRVISIRDNGAGFDMAESDYLFQPFRRLGTARDFPGVGIGLTTVQRIIHRHGGEIWAESAPGKGAAFHFTLP